LFVEEPGHSLVVIVGENAFLVEASIYRAFSLEILIDSIPGAPFSFAIELAKEIPAQILS
jgi:hypothetical protein